MKKIMTLMFALACMTTACAAGSYAKTGNTMEQARRVKGFKAVTLVGSPTVYYTQGKNFSVRVVAPKNLMNEVKTEVKGTELKIWVNTANSKNIFNLISTNDASKVKVYVTSPDLIAATLIGSGDFKCKGHLDTDNLRIQLKGSGDMEFADIICDKIEVELIGSGDLDIKKVEAIDSKLSLVGSGDMTVNQKNVDRTSIQLKGSGDMKVNFNHCGTASSDLRGSGDIELSGSLKSLTKNSLGSGCHNTGNLRVGR
jgi:hypothetical protein